MAAKRPPDLVWVSEDPTRSRPAPNKRPARQLSARKPDQPVFKARVKTVAETATAGSVAATAGVDNEIIQRIKKCLDRANHQGTPQAEAKAALHLASRLMGQYNVSQAEVLAHEPPAKRSQYAGQSTVAIERTDGRRGMVVRIYGYVDTLSRAVETFFECRSYRTRCVSHVEWTFYGLAENTVAAAMAFEMVYNVVLDWSMRYPASDRSSYIEGAGHELRKMADEKRREEMARAVEVENEALAAREIAENADRQVQLDRLAEIPDNNTASAVESQQQIPAIKEEESLEAGKSSSNRGACHRASAPSPGNDTKLESADTAGCLSDDEDQDREESVELDFDMERDSGIAPTADLDEEIQRLVKKEVPEMGYSPEAGMVSLGAIKQESPSEDTVDGIEFPTIKTEPPTAPTLNEPTWRSQMQLVTFRKNAETIATDYLKEKQIKLRSGPSKSHNIRNHGVYQEGKADGRTIDVFRKRIGA